MAQREQSHPTQDWEYGALQAPSIPQVYAPADSPVHGALRVASAS